MSLKPLPVVVYRQVDSMVLLLVAVHLELDSQVLVVAQTRLRSAPALLKHQRPGHSNHNLPVADLVDLVALLHNNLSREVILHETVRVVPQMP
jgi:hypothetical protein